MTGSSENDWLEDSAHENGNYFRKCLSCGCDFIGHKRKFVCKKCYTSAIEKYNKMTPEEREEFEIKRNIEVIEFFKNRE